MNLDMLTTQLSTCQTIAVLLQPAPTPDPQLEWYKAAASFLGPIIAAIIAVIGVAVTAYLTIRRGLLDARYDYASEILRFRIRQLQEFYAPMHLLIETSRKLYEKLIWTIPRIRPGFDVQGFRLLDHMDLRKEETLDPLISDILETGKKMSSLITKNAGLIEGGLTQVYIDYMAHYNILRSAEKGPAPPDDVIEGWQEFYYYPRLLNREVIEGYKIVLAHLESYESAGDRIISDLLKQKAVEIGKYRRQLMDNIYYYEERASEYAAKFDRFDLSGVRTRFLNNIESRQPQRDASRNDAIRILDVGCGTGRDTYEFLARGYAVTAIDASPAMLRECKNKLKKARDQTEDTRMRKAAKDSRTIEMTFDEVRFRNRFDGVWAAASLLHVPAQQMTEILQRLAQALKPSGILFVSFKHGRGEREYNGRIYSYFGRRRVRRILKKIGGAKAVAIWLTEADGKNIGRRSQRLAWGLEFIRRYDRTRWLNILITREPV
jgi:SAM-dependent methyltransferase